MNPHDLVDRLDNSGARLIRSKEEFDKAVAHIFGLLTDAHFLYGRNRYPSSVFLAITALEETAKAHLGLFSGGFRRAEPNSRNVFFDHKAKHLLAALETVRMGSRFIEAIGLERVNELMRMARNGDLMEVRNSALYFERKRDELTVPADRMDEAMARELLLFAVEVFDDALVGFTNLTVKLSDKTDGIFQDIMAE